MLVTKGMISLYHSVICMHFGAMVAILYILSLYHNIRKPLVKMNLWYKLVTNLFIEVISQIVVNQNNAINDKFA